VTIGFQDIKSVEKIGCEGQSVTMKTVTLKYPLKYNEKVIIEKEIR